jgi:small-conductance mechanosensitive channel
MTWNNTAVIIPNETAINHMMINHSVLGKVRIEIPVSGVTVNGDLSGIQKALLESRRGNTGRFEGPAARCGRK